MATKTTVSETECGKPAWLLGMTSEIPRRPRRTEDLGDDVLGFALHPLTTWYMRSCYLKDVNKKIMQLPAVTPCQDCFNSIHYSFLSSLAKGYFSFCWPLSRSALCVSPAGIQAVASSNLSHKTLLLTRLKFEQVDLCSL